MLKGPKNPLSGRVFPEQVRLLYRGAPESYIGTILAAGLLVLIQRQQIERYIVLSWLLYILLVTVGRSLLVYRYWQSETQSEHALQWNRRYVAGSALAGLGWGAAGMYLYPPASLAHQVFLAFVIGGMAAGSVATLSPRLEAFVAFFLPAVTTILMRVGLHGDPFHNAMTVMILLYIGALLVVASRLHGTIRSTLVLRDENAHLIQDLMEAKDRTDTLNDNLKKEIIERKRTEAALRKSQEHLELKVQQRTSELEKKHGQLLQASKLASIGELATGVAHELNNPLNNIGLIAGNLLEAAKQCNEPYRSSLLANLQMVNGQVTKAAQIVSHLRTFGRAPRPEKTTLPLHAVLRAAHRLMDQALRLSNVNVHLKLSEADPMVSDNGIQLEQVFVNLFTNARDSLKQSATKNLVVITQTCGDWGEVVVQDTGLGIASDDLQRIFDPFFTTKDVGSGTGLGLSITYGIVRDHGGTIAVDSVPGQGAKFTIRLPLIAVEPKGNTTQGKPIGPLLCAAPDVPIRSDMEIV